MLVLLLAGGPSACAGDAPRATLHGAQGPVDVGLELALTPQQIQRGLMYRTDLADGDGMLFVFGNVAARSFWMKNTLIPLDMIFIAEADGGAAGVQAGRIVGIRANTRPLSTASITVGTPSRWVLEVPGGWAARRGVRVGDRVELHDVPPPQASP